jgi:hypothetical protein
MPLVEFLWGQKILQTLFMLLILWAMLSVAAGLMIGPFMAGLSRGS